MRAFYYEAKAAEDNAGNKYFGVVFANSIYNLFWTIDISLNPYAVKFFELRSGVIVEMFGKEHKARMTEFEFREKGFKNEWREFTTESRSRIYKEKK